jgi:hypothetical protein
MRDFKNTITVPESPSLSMALTSAPALTNNLMDSILPVYQIKKKTTLIVIHILHISYFYCPLLFF